LYISDAPSFREIIREENQNTRIALLEYLKQLHPIEWQNFFKDTMILAEETAMFNGVNPFANDGKGQSKADQLPSLPQSSPFAHVFGHPSVRRSSTGLFPV